MPPRAATPQAGGIMNIWEVLLLVALVIGGIYYFRKRE
ncbi:MAG: hypothetical protein DMG31_18755 [Acidobacteria bacterium]|nr:MAG: hypothetical protein DMG31_18755 [Acidobacteriota bacterium]